jgi:2-dehydro-3-deoxyphosphogluconate aldolase/(4S)-4-hydroxy-2-oxoglutarate aldolase
MTTPGAITIIEQAAGRYDQDVLFGAGSVLDDETARAAILAGAKFVVGPTIRASMIQLCNRYGVPVIPGAFTPTEILTAWESGATLVKLFPADVGGPSYLKAIRAPLPQLALVPVGGVSLDTTAAFIRAGAAAVGVGSALINQRLLTEGDFPSLTERARRFVEEVAQARDAA